MASSTMRFGFMRLVISVIGFYYKESPVSHSARGMNRGLFYTRDGKLMPPQCKR